MATTRSAAAAAPPPVTPLAYTITNVCRISGCGRTKVYEEIAAGRLKVTRIGRRTLIRHAELERWLSEAEDA